MYNKELFERICNGTCTDGELFDFTARIDKKEFDTNNPFDKYYSIQAVLDIADRYKKGVISEKFLTLWSTAYAWIITGGFKCFHPNEFTLRDVIIWKIIDWLDALAFFDSSEEYCKIENYIQSLTALDTVLRDIDDCTAAYSRFDFDDEEDCFETGVLIVNEKAKYFLEIYDDFNFDVFVIKLDEIDNATFYGTVEKLTSSGYCPLIKPDLQ